MKKLIKLLSVVVAGAAALVLSAVVSADTVSVRVDGLPIKFDVKPSIMDDRTMVPMRKVFEALGADVLWEEQTRTAIANKNGTRVQIAIGDKFLIKNDVKTELDVPAALVDGRTLVPVRAVSEAFDCDVEWDGKTKTVYIFTDPISLEQIPDYSGTPYIAVNGNVSDFIDGNLYIESFENYSSLDSLGRCRVACASLSADTMPTEERGEIGMVKPSGWQSVKYDCVDGKYLYNRCHLVGYQLSGENANEANLITGTRYMNVDGMLPFENMVADYIDETQNHVLYRVTPIYEGNNLVADGVLMEAFSVEDNGGGINFNVYCYNVQPGVGIDYATGNSWADSQYSPVVSETVSGTYVLNKNSMKFHYADCSGAKKISDKNREEIISSREELINNGYTACGICKP